MLLINSLLSYAGNSDYIIYSVKKGDNIWNISQMYQVSQNNLLSFNNISENDLLSIGQTIKIPQMNAKNNTRLIHFVKKGETLWSISRKYNVSLNVMITANHLENSNFLSEGQSLLIPGIESKSVTENQSNKNLNLPIEKQKEMLKPVTYIVKKGDNLWNIAQKHGVSVTTIVGMNNLVNSELLKIGQRLEIPGIGGGLSSTDQSDKPVNIDYSVKKGDNLWSISKKFDVKMSAIISLNNMKEISQLSIGEKLKIPITNMDIAKAAGYDQNTEIQEIVYYVKKGESLWNISREYDVKLETIIAANHIADASKIVSGQRLIIPKIPGARSSICDFAWPVKGRITSSYGTRLLNGHKDFHSGIDIGSPTGTNIAAAEKGKVSYAGYMRGYGNVIILSHAGGYSTVYAHNSVNLVKKDQYINRGTIIGKIGQTGNTTGPHLHFEIRLNGNPRNPLPYLQ